MKTRDSIVVVGLFATACDEDKATKKTAVTASPPTSAPTGTPTSSSLAPASASPPSSAAAVDKPLGERLRCDLLMPEKTLPGALAGMKVGQPPPDCPACGPTCTLVKPNNPIEGASVKYVCNEKFDRAAADRQIAELKKTLKKTQAITEFGRGGIGGEKDSGLFYDTLVYDDDTDCAVTVSWMRGKREEATMAAKYALAGVKPGDLK